MIADMLEDAETPFDALGSILEFGQIPPPELLLVIDEMFKAYSTSQGELTWEEACFGKPPRGVGVYAIRRWQYFANDFKLFAKLVNENEQSENPISQHKLAENLFKKRSSVNMKITTTHPDIDSFLRQFRRWRNKNSDNKAF